MSHDKTWFARHKVLTAILGFFILFILVATISGPSTDQEIAQEASDASEIAFDAPSYLVQGIEAVKADFGETVSTDEPNPSSVKWAESYEKNGYTMSVTYVQETGEIDYIFVYKGSYSDPMESTWLSSMEEVEALASSTGIDLDSNAYDVSVLRPGSDGDKYTGIRIE